MSQVGNANDSSAARSSAPGKLMIIGEYAVLEGADAIVAAVDRRVTATLSATGDALPPEAAAAQREAERQLGVTLGEPVALDVSQLKTGGQKLGLGSSSAAAAAVAALVYQRAGKSLVEPGARDALFRAAFLGHKSVAPEGSGSDVAAAVYGGFIRLRRANDTLDVRPVLWPEDVEIRVVWSGNSARTSDLVAAVRELQKRDQGHYRALMDQLRFQSDRFIDSAMASDTSELLDSAEAYSFGMGELGRAAGVSIITDSLRWIRKLARKCGGAAKPSGAGGGDVALGFFDDPAAAKRFEQVCAQANLDIVPLSLGVDGVRIGS
jgi:phosphomevalonate kinase